MLIYIVRESDTVDMIAENFGISVDSIIYANQIPYPYALAVGQALLLTEVTVSETLSVSENEMPVFLSETQRNIYVGGYAYPFISRWVLEQTLPYLTDLFVFSYGFTAEGELIPPLVDDLWMIELAKSYNVAPILTLTPFGEDGLFNNRLISAVVNNPDARAHLRDEILFQITERGYEGLDIDFEYILASDRTAFVDFVIYMREAVNALGYPVSVALAPKSSADQEGLLYEGKDYPALGAAADYVLLMTYEWGYMYGPPMAVAPLDQVRKVVDYAISVIPPEKINLGIPNYGYDWPLPFMQGVTKAQTIGNIQAVQRAIQYGAAIQFDRTAKAPFYYYHASGVDHEVWFEDVRSMNETFRLLEEYELRGCSYWTIMQLFRANWLLLNECFGRF